MNKYYKVNENTMRELIHNSLMFCVLQNIVKQIESWVYLNNSPLQIIIYYWEW